MSNEGSASFTFRIDKDNLHVQTTPVNFSFDVTTGSGPSPGKISATPTGTDVDLSQLTSPGMCLIRNLDTVSYVEYGIYDPVDDRFQPLGEILPGEFYPLRFSRHFGDEMAGAGTGSVGTMKMRLRIRSGTVYDATVSVEAYER